MDGVSAAPRVLSFPVLNEITKGFSKDMKVGAGSYGNVYKGQLTDGEMIAVKVLHYIPGLDDEQFQKEYRNLANLQHENIVRLIGYCHETFGEFIDYKGQKILAQTIKRALCFEYMQNGSLDSYIADESTGHGWSTRYAIIKGICQGLKYLHEELVPPMWHLDLKPGNILLDENMVPKIADFGLSRLFGGEQTHMTKTAIGTHGYIPPEYIDAALITAKFDIFSLGVIIIKIIAGPKGYFRIAEMSPRQFIELVHGKWKNKLQTTTSDDAFEPYCEQVKRCIEIALSCVDADRHKRPSIGVIIDKLNETETVIQLLGASMIDKAGSSTYKKIRKEDRKTSESIPPSNQPVAPAQHLSLRQLEDITNNFSHELILGGGGRAVVYKGVLQHGETVAVKRLVPVFGSKDHFENEVNLLMRLEHPNIVRLVGYCRETRKERLLWLEFLANGCLDNYISDASSGLDWHTRYKIIEGVSYGLHYLHEQLTDSVVHAALNPSNISLDENMLPKITSFSQSRVLDQSQTIHTMTTAAKMGYMPPEYLREGIISRQFDIFCLGVTIMVVITGHTYESRTSSEEFIERELHEWRNRLQNEPGYTSLETDCHLIERCIQIALICANPERTKRPTIKKVIDMLQGLESMEWYIRNELSSLRLEEEL